MKPVNDNAVTLDGLRAASSGLKPFEQAHTGFAVFQLQPVRRCQIAGIDIRVDGKFAEEIKIFAHILPGFTEVFRHFVHLAVRQDIPSRIAFPQNRIVLHFDFPPVTYQRETAQVKRLRNGGDGIGMLAFRLRFLRYLERKQSHGFAFRQPNVVHSFRLGFGRHGDLEQVRHDGYRRSLNQ